MFTKFLSSRLPSTYPVDVFFSYVLWELTAPVKYPYGIWAGFGIDNVDVKENASMGDVDVMRFKDSSEVFNADVVKGV